MNDCPTTEELSAFIDGKLSHENRESVVAHLGDCPICYSVVSESLTIREELISRSRARIKKHLSYSLPAALAAAAVLLVVFRMVQHAPEFTGKSERESAYQDAQIGDKPRPQPDFAVVTRSFAGKLADRLARNNEAAALSGISINQFKPAASFGFSSSVPMEKVAFRIGKVLTSLELALKAKDQEKIELFEKQLIELLKPMESSYGLLPSIVEQKGPSGNAGTEEGRYEGFSKAVEALFENKKEAVFLKFGAWVEAAGLAAEMHDAAFFQPADVTGFRQELEKSGVPVGTLNNLSQMEPITSLGGIQPDQFETVAHLLADIKEMF